MGDNITVNGQWRRMKWRLHKVASYNIQREGRYLLRNSCFTLFSSSLPGVKICCCYPSGIVHAVADILLMCWSLKHENRQNSEGLHVFI